MKKLFALVLTLALVFAIAAPAMAATWGAGTAPTGNPYVVAVTLLQKNSDSYGNAYYTAYPANLGVIANTPVYFQVDITVPSATDLGNYYPNPTTAGVFGATCTVKNIGSLKIEKEFVDGEEAANVGDVAVIDTGAIKLTSGTWATGAADEVVYSFIASGVVTATKDASITAAVGYKAKAALPITKTVGTVTYEFDGNTITGDETPNATVMTLTLNGASVVTGMTLSVGGVLYTVQAGPVFQYVDADGKIATLSDPTTLSVVMAKYNAITGLLGFKAGDANIYYTEANILANFGYTNRATATATYKAYSSALTVTDGTSVPNTGDNMSVIGFVMVGLAILATAAVVVKKVRA